MSRVLWLIAAALVIPLSIGASGLGRKPIFHGTRVRAGEPINHESAPTCSLPDGGPSICHMFYNGGKVISNVKVYAVYWGANVDAGGNLDQFFNTVTNSKFLDWLNEYDTNIAIDAGTAAGTPGTGQLIGRGTYGGAFTISPSTSGETCPSNASPGATLCLQDSDISRELDSQITAGNLPPADANTLYFTFFPPHTFITDNGGSCIAGGFCGYHGTSPATAAREFYYSVMPDHGVDCAIGCGNDSNPFNNLTQTSAHELAEAITDSEVGRVGNGPDGPPLGWYDDNNGEIGDMCGGSAAPGQIDAGTMVFDVQEVFSNVTGMCETSRVAPTDFSIALGSTSATSTPRAVLVAGGSTVHLPVLVSGTGSSGSPSTVSLALLTTLPSGVSHTLSPSVAPGSSADLALTANASAGVSTDLVVTVKGTAGNVVHTASALATVEVPTASDDFSVDLSPSSQTVSPGSFVDYAISTAIISGSSVNIGAIHLSVTGLPATVQPTFAISGSTTEDLTPGGSTTLTLTADPTAAPTALTTFTLHAVGTSNNVTHTRTASVAVLPGDFSLTLAPSTAQTIASTGTRTFNVTASGLSGSPANITLAVTGLPSGVIPGFDKNPIQPGATGATLTLTATSALASSATTFTITGTDSDNVSRTTTGSIQVLPATSDFSIALAPDSLNLARGSSGTLAVATAVVSGSPGTIGLSTTGLPTGVSGSFSPASVTAGSSSTLTLAASSSAAFGSGISFSVVGTAGSVTHSAGGTLTVASSPPTVTITNPRSGAVVSGTVEIDATATVGAGATLSKIDILVDHAVLASLSTSPAQAFWPSKEGADGLHTLIARAVDSTGSSRLSAPVAVTVDNASTSGGTTGGKGGCTSAGGSLSALLGILAILRRRRVT